MVWKGCNERWYGLDVPYSDNEQDIMKYRFSMSDYASFYELSFSLVLTRV